MSRCRLGSTPKGQAVDADPAQVAQWLEEISPEEWEQRLESSPELASVSLSLMGDALSGSDAALSERVADYLAAGARSRSNRLGRRGGPFADDELQSLLTLMFIRPERFNVEEPFSRSGPGDVARSDRRRCPDGAARGFAVFY